MLVLDASGSMDNADMSGGGDRMTAAREAAKLFVDALPAGARVALVTYGDQTPEDAPLDESSCADVSVKLPLGEDRDGVGPVLDSLKPSGWTPISAALTKASELVPAGERASMVLVSDGEDACAPPDPCDTAAGLVAKNTELAISTIGVRAHSGQLACIADRGRGISVTADSAAQLARRLPALSDPATAAEQLSANGAQRIRPGTAYAAIKEQHPDFPDLPASGDDVIRVTWRNCEWEFDAQAVLQGIVLKQGATIDGISMQDPADVLDGLGTPVKVEPGDGGDVRYYAADERLKLAWKVTVVGGRVTAIVLCACLPVAPCPPPNEEIRRLQNDPHMQIEGAQCTSDRNWAVIQATFEPIQRGGFSHHPASGRRLANCAEAYSSIELLGLARRRTAEGTRRDDARHVRAPAHVHGVALGPDQHRRAWADHVGDVWNGATDIGLCTPRHTPGWVPAGVGTNRRRARRAGLARVP